MDDGSGLAKASLGVSIVAILVAIGTASFQALADFAVGATTASTSYATAATAVCLEWARFVNDEQADPRWVGVDPATVDERIDRQGVVLNSRVLDGSIIWGGTLPDPAPTGTAMPTPEPTPTPIVNFSLAETCGSAAEYRLARESDDPLILYPAELPPG